MADDRQRGAGSDNRVAADEILLGDKVVIVHGDDDLRPIAGRLEVAHVPSLDAVVPQKQIQRWPAPEQLPLGGDVQIDRVDGVFPAQLRNIISDFLRRLAVPHHDDP